MIYPNASQEAVMALERARTDEYMNNACYSDEVVKCCNLCGAKDPEEFFVTSDGVNVGCSECVKRVDWEEYEV